ncbi:MAG: hypothetical protein COB49_13070 [Alphaproteobacteria bacterium]|nr:MAG: hypothetical protein COB49_13070 [Alphaproteobacteria bacterium]
MTDRADNPEQEPFGGKRHDLLPFTMKREVLPDVETIPFFETLVWLAWGKYAPFGNSRPRDKAWLRAMSNGRAAWLKNNRGKALYGLSENELVLIKLFFKKRHELARKQKEEMHELIFNKKIERLCKERMGQVADALMDAAMQGRVQMSGKKKMQDDEHQIIPAEWLRAAPPKTFNLIRATIEPDYEALEFSDYSNVRDCEDDGLDSPFRRQDIEVRVADLRREFLTPVRSRNPRTVDTPAVENELLEWVKGEKEKLGSPPTKNDCFAWGNRRVPGVSQKTIKKYRRGLPGNMKLTSGQKPKRNGL